MELTHTFTVPASLEDTWSAFNDIESVAGCFPGASVTSVEGDTFHGSCKVKLGPIALVYNGSGTFTEKDEAAHRMVIAAKGKDKRGNGTAGADVVATMTAAGDASTDVEVVTDLAITGKPAQFGRGVMQDVSDKLLQQFIDCLEKKLGGADQEPAPAPAAAGSTAPAAPAGPPAAPVPDAGPSAAPRPGTVDGAAPPVSAAASARSDDSLDLGATLLPVLVKSYGKQLAAGLGVLVLVVWVLRRLRR